MNRREFIILLGGAAGWPITGRAQQPARMRRIGVLLGISENDPEARTRVSAFRRGLRDLGWSEGRNLTIDYRFAVGDPLLIKTYATELVNLAPDVILANSTPVITALRQATSSIPIVFAVVNDPVGQGFISSQARPGGNITGFTFIEFEMVGKWLGMLKDLMPGLNKAFVMFNPTTAPYYDVFLRSFETTRHSLGIEANAVPVRQPTEIEFTVAQLAQSRGVGLIAPADPFIVVHRDKIIQSAERHRVPAMYTYRQFVLEGGLMSYGPSTSDIFRRSATYVDRILSGEKPAELPAQSPNTFELTINLQTAGRLGLRVSNTLLAIADEVIE
jgi:putative tryptophan/tyrosine transport system substrate-binding protein